MLPKKYSKRNPQNKIFTDFFLKIFQEIFVAGGRYQSTSIRDKSHYSRL